MITTQRELRAAFWELSDMRIFERTPPNERPAYVYRAFAEWLDTLKRDGQISEALASRATL